MKSYQHPIAQLFITSAIAGLILAVLAPFGTGAFPISGRLAYWIGMCIAGGVGAGAAGWLADKRARKLPALVYAFVQSIGASACVAPFLFALHRPASLRSALMILFYIWFISMVISSVGALLRRSHESPAIVDQTPKRAKLYSRLAPKFRAAQVYSIAAEDHYVRVYTSIGEEMILMRLSDAIAETTPLRGVQTHRSWWVAEGGIETVRRKDGKLILTLKNKIIAPVSRSGAKLVKEAGWV